MKIKINDKVKIVAGKDKGKEGKVTKIFPKTSKVIVENMNKYKRHIKKQNDQNPGGVVEIERPLPISSVQIICSSCKQITRVGYKTTKLKKVRICKKCSGELDSK